MYRWAVSRNLRINRFLYKRFCINQECCTPPNSKIQSCSNLPSDKLVEFFSSVSGTVIGWLCRRRDQVLFALTPVYIQSSHQWSYYAVLAFHAVRLWADSVVVTVCLSQQLQSLTAWLEWHHCIEWQQLALLYVDRIQITLYPLSLLSRRWEW